MDKVLVKNAADEKQVQNAKVQEKLGQEKVLNDLKFLLKTPEGRRYIWRLLSHCKVFGSIWHASALIHYNSGMQDVGHFILADINDADPESLLLMIKENKGEN